MSETLKPYVKIRTSEAKDYAARGYYVIQSLFQAQVQIAESGAVIKAGDTMATLEWDANCDKALAKGFIKVIEKPSADAAKRAKKKADDEAVATSAPSPAPQVAPKIEAAAEPTSEVKAEITPIVATSVDKTEKLDDQNTEV